MLHHFINLDKWNELPKSYQAIVQTALAFRARLDDGKYDTRNPAALKRLVAGGAQLRPFPQPVMEACYKAANEVYAETTRTTPTSRRCTTAWSRFRDDQYLWWQVAEYTYDSFMIRARPRA